MRQHDLFEVLDKATTHATTIADSGPLTERSPSPTRKGRLPQGRASGTYRIGQERVGELLKSYLGSEAHQKEMTAASMRLLILNLREVSCPGEFLRRVEQALEEKLTHADLLAHASCTRKESVAFPPAEAALTDLWGLTLELATERCVVDTYAAARFAFQARRADSPRLRVMFEDIARQDAVHVTLFWELLAWALSHLSPARARQVVEEQKKVREEIRLAIEAPLPAELHELAGVPDADCAHALLDALEFQLWSDVAA